MKCPVLTSVGRTHFKGGSHVGEVGNASTNDEDLSYKDNRGGHVRVRTGLVKTRHRERFHVRARYKQPESYCLNGAKQSVNVARLYCFHSFKSTLKL